LSGAWRESRAARVGLRVMVSAAAGIGFPSSGAWRHDAGKRDEVAADRAGNRQAPEATAAIAQCCTAALPQNTSGTGVVPGNAEPSQLSNPAAVGYSPPRIKLSRIQHVSVLISPSLTRTQPQVAAASSPTSVGRGHEHAVLMFPVSSYSGVKRYADCEGTGLRRKQPERAGSSVTSSAP